MELNNLAEAKGRDEATAEGVAKAPTGYEDLTALKDFKNRYLERAIAFKRKLGNSVNAWAGENL